MEFKPVLEGLDNLEHALDQLAERPTDFTRVQSETYAALSDAVQRNFDTQGGLVGGWRPRKPRRSAEPVTRPLLQETGSLLRSLTRRGAVGSIFEVEPESVTYGSSLPHAAAHQSGVPQRNLPARPVIPPAGELEDAVRAVVTKDAVAFARHLGFDVR